MKKWIVDHKWLRAICLLSLVSLLSGSVLIANMKTTPFHGDESGWISAGYYYTDLLLNHDFDWAKWRCAQCGDWGSSLTMPLGKWMIGVSLRAYQETANQRFFAFYWFDRSRIWNEMAGKIPPQSMLVQGRRASVVLGVLCCLLVFLIGYRSYNWLVGGIAVILLLTNTLFIESATRVMTDIHYDLLLVAGCLATSLLWVSAKRRSQILVACLSGVLAGLAGLVKESGIVLGALVFLAVAGYRALLSRLGIKELLLHLGVFSVSAIAVVYLLNPYYWPSIKAIDKRALVLESTQFIADVKDARARTESLRQKYPQLSNLGNVLNFPMQFVARRRYMVNEPTFGQWDGGSRFVAIQRKLLATSSRFPAVWILMAIGIVVSAVRTVKDARHRRVGLQSLPLLYFLVNYLFILCFMELNWDRYYIPILTAGSLIVAVGVYEVALATYRVAYRRITYSNKLSVGDA